MSLDNILSEIKRVQDELQEMVVEKDSLDDEVMKKTEELEELQRYYSFLLNQMQ